VAVRGVHHRLGESGIIDQAYLAQTVEHRLADLLGNPAPAQRIGQLGAASRPRRKQP
jgi:hypothetical protein